MKLESGGMQMSHKNKITGKCDCLYGIIMVSNHSCVFQLETCRHPLRYKYGPPDHYQTTYDSKTKFVVFYSLSNAFDLFSGSKFRYFGVNSSGSFKHGCE